MQPNAIRSLSCLPPHSSSPEVQDNNAITLSPDWSEELQLAAKNAVAKELAKKSTTAILHTFFRLNPKRLNNLPGIMPRRIGLRRCRKA